MLLAGLLGWIARFYPFANSSPVRGGFTPGVDLTTWYTIQYGRLPGLLPAATYTGNLSNGTLYLGEFARALFNAPLLLIAGKTSLYDSFYFYEMFLWPGLVLLPTVLLLGVHAMRIHASGERRPDDATAMYAYIFGLAVLGFPSMIAYTSNSGVMDSFGWIMVGLLFYTVLRTRTGSTESRTKFTALTILLFAVVNIYHHTTALFVALMLLGVYALGRQRHSSTRMLRPSLVFLYVTLLIAYVAYLTLTFLGYFDALGSTLGSLANGILGLSKPTPLGSLATSERFSSDRIAFRVVDLSLIGLVFLYLGWGVVRRLVLNWPRMMLSGFAIGIIVAAIFVLGWGGFGAFFVRITALAAVLSILGVGYILLNGRRGLRRETAAIGIVVLLISPFAFVGSQPALQETLRWPEAAAIDWAGHHVDREAAILSDSRVASPLIYYGFTSPIGFEDGSSNLSFQLRTLSLYFYLYHPSNQDQSKQAFCTEQAISGIVPQYLVYSDYFSDPDTGIVGFISTYPPASPSVPSVLDNFTALQKVYNSGPVSVFRLETSEIVC